MLSSLLRNLKTHFKNQRSDTQVSVKAARAAEERNDFTLALALLEKTYVDYPQSRECHVALGRVAAKAGRLSDSIATLSNAIKKWPDDAELETTLANVLILNFQPEIAAQHFRRALAIHAQHIPAMIGLANALRELGNFDSAVQILTDASTLSPPRAELFDNLGLVLQDLGRTEESIAMFTRALQLKPALHEAALHRGFTYLLAGDFEKGWIGYERRFVNSETPSLEHEIPRWEGERLASDTLFIASEQGIGDEIMFASCIPDVQVRTSPIILECSSKLTCLFSTSFPGIAVVEKGKINSYANELKKISHTIPIGSLPALLRRNKSHFPKHAGYLIADGFKRKTWRDRLSNVGPGPKIGIVWSGGTRETRQKIRSISLSNWTPILSISGIHFISLQHTPCDDELRSFREQTGVRITHWQDAVTDVEQTAALVSELTLIISVQTAIVHLGGALGKPVWALVPARPEWRYLYAGSTLPWYPSVRLFRQAHPGNWASTIQEVALALQAFRL